MALLVLLLATAAYLPGLSGSFLFDDYPNVVSNPRIRMESLDAGSIASAAKAYEPGAYGRPLATITFALDHYFAGGMVAPQFKRTGLAVHVVNTLLVLLLVAALLRLAPSGGQATLPAMAITLFWAVHPLQVSSVLYVVQRMETLSLTFVLAGLWAYVAGRTRQQAGRRGWHLVVMSGLLAAVGMLSKETAALFPAYTLALELTVLGFAAADPRTSRRWRVAYAVLVASAAATFVLLIVPMYLDPLSYAFRDFTVGERLLTQFRVLAMYIGWILLPLPNQLLFYYDQYEWSRSLVDPGTTLAAALFVVALLAAAWRFRARQPYFSLGILWFFAAHALTSNMVPFELVFEHRNYFAVLGIGIAAWSLLRLIPLRDGPAILRTAVVAVFAGLFALTAIRAATWGEPLLLASDMVHRNPLSARASNDLGEQYMVLAQRSASSPFYFLAEKEFERGSRLPNASPLPEQALLMLASTAGVEAKPEWWDRLLAKISTRNIGPQEKMALLGLMKNRRRGYPLDDERLIEALTVLFLREQMPPSSYAQFGDFVLEYSDQDALATRMFEMSVSTPPLDPEWAARIISTLVADDHPAQARAVLAKARGLGLVDEHGNPLGQPGTRPVGGVSPTR